MARKDWLFLFGGSVLSLLLADIVTPGVAEQIFIMTVHGLAHLFAGGIEPRKYLPEYELDNKFIGTAFEVTLTTS